MYHYKLYSINFLIIQFLTVVTLISLFEYLLLELDDAHAIHAVNLNIIRYNVKYKV